MCLCVNERTTLCLRRGIAAIEIDGSTELNSEQTPLDTILLIEWCPSIIVYGNAPSLYICCCRPKTEVVKCKSFVSKYSMF